MSKTSIEWADVVWNPVSGCTRVSPGCDHCYAVRMTDRLEAMGIKKYAGLTGLNGKGDRHFNGKVRCHDHVLDAPLGWRKPWRVFVNSMSDLFHPEVPFEFIDKVFAVMAISPTHTFQVLTKRPQRMADYMPGVGHRIYDVVSDWLDEGAGQDTFLDSENWDRVHDLAGRSASGGRREFTAWNTPLPNVWLGVSVEDQATADQRIPELLDVPAAVRFLSCEPLLGPVCLLLRTPHFNVVEGERIRLRHELLHWVIVGGESGPGARPMAPDWVRSIRDECRGSLVPFFFKQWGQKENNSDAWLDPDEVGGGPAGKGGRRLDGVTWNEFPAAVKQEAPAT